MQKFIKSLFELYELNGRIYNSEIDQKGRHYGISRYKIKNILEDLEEKGVIKKFTENISAPGRPKLYYEFISNYNKTIIDKALKRNTYSLILFLKHNGSVSIYKDSVITSLDDYAIEIRFLFLEGKPIQSIPYWFIERIQHTTCQQEENFVIGMNFTIITDVVTEKDFNKSLFQL